MQITNDTQFVFFNEISSYDSVIEKILHNVLFKRIWETTSALILYRIEVKFTQQFFRLKNLEYTSFSIQL